MATLLNPSALRLTVDEVAPPSVIAAEAQSRVSLFHTEEPNRLNPKPPTMSEHAWHDHAARYLALGMSQKDAAQAVGCSPATLNQLLRAPWFTERVRSYMGDGKDIMQLVKAEALGAFMTLVEICNDPKIAPAVRVSAAKDLLDRHLGKPSQHIIHEAPTTSSDPVAEAERLEAETRALTLSATGH